MKKGISFIIDRIETTEFATIDENFNEDHEIGLSANVIPGINISNKAIGLETKFSFSQGENTFLIIAVNIWFKIEEDCWASLIDTENNINVNKKDIGHLAMISIGTIRGVLHSKIEKTKYNKIVLPTVDTTLLINKDLSFNLDTPSI